MAFYDDGHFYTVYRFVLGSKIYLQSLNLNSFFNIG